MALDRMQFYAMASAQLGSVRVSAVPSLISYQSGASFSIGVDPINTLARGHDVLIFPMVEQGGQGTGGYSG